MSEIILNVNVAVEIENKTICVPCNIETTAEDVCIFLSKQLLISPLARHIFALRIEKSVFLPPKAPVYDHKNSYIDFRIRFKVNNVLKLAKIDPNSYNYYFHQARIDVLENKVPGLIYEQYRRELLGLGITDMHRYILEKGTAMSSVERDYKKFIPKEVVKRHPFFMKAPIHNTLVGLQKSVKSVKQVKAEYIQQLELIGPEYLSEEYKAFHDKDGQTCLVIVKVSPIQSEGVKYCFESKKEQWHHICKIEEISSVSIRENTVEIYTNRTPIYLRFHAKSIMFSFISLLDGYYRLSCKWTFNICRDVAMLSLENLKALKCHGPVGSDFSYTKLKEKRNNKFGCYLLRESEKNYDVFYIDVCMQNGKILSFKLDKISESEYLFHDDSTKYKSIQDILKAYKDPDGAIYLGECLPPSDYDVSPLLLCKSDTLNNDSQVVNSTSLDDILAAPLCISPEDLKREEKDRKCLKWNKERKKVKISETNFTKYDKFPKEKFQEQNLGDAKKFCRNPDGDVGGPWCFVENEYTSEIKKEYCDIPFCDDKECSLFAKNSFTYMHYTDFNNTLENMTFSVKLWDSDSYNTASARLVLTLMALPLTGKEIHDLGIGIEIFIGNNVTGLRYGNKDSRPDYEPTPGILKSSEYTTFSLSWHAGFITLNKEGELKPIFLAEIKTKNNLLGFRKDAYNCYSAQGTNVLWNFPFCMDDFDCDVQTTTGKEFQQFWPLRGKSLGYDLYVHVRSHHSACIIFVSSPTIESPYLKIVFKGSNNYTRVTIKEFALDSEIVLKELQLVDIINYWEWSEFSISVFANSLQIYMKKAIGLHPILEAKHEVFRNLRWFSVSSDNTVAHWSFYCKPPEFSNPPQALLPECALNPQELTYKGTQDITSTGLPCLPWSGGNMIPVDIDTLFVNKTILEAWNYCRDPSGIQEGTYCYTISLSPERKIEKNTCRLRKCKSELCKTAGTGNDFIGTLATTRSGRHCDVWVKTTHSVHGEYMHTYNDSWFADMSQADAVNFCRNPTRDISGSWCYTTDPQVVVDVCNVRDCDRPEEGITIINTNVLARKIFILPQWKETGLHGGLRFSIKEWNPDVLDGLQFVFHPREGAGEVKLLIGANYNEKVILYKNDELVMEKTFPHLIAAGKWTDFWLQIRRGEVMLGFEGVPTSLFEWRDPDMASAFEPMLMSYGSIFGDPIGLFFKNDECHTENTTDTKFLKFMSLGTMTKNESSVHRHMTFKVRGAGVAYISFMWVTNNYMSYLVMIDTITNLIQLIRVDAPPHATQGYQHLLRQSQIIPNVINANSWTTIALEITDKVFIIKRNDQIVINYNSDRPILVYWFSVAVSHGWITWTANCEPLDMDGPPKDGGWSSWSPWVCSVACGGGEGYRTRTCSNPRPNLSGRLCSGSPTATGTCNDFPCGDISPETMEIIRTKLQTESHSFVINEGESIIINNDREILKIIKKESPEAYYEWSFNGLLIESDKNKEVTLKYDDVAVTNAKQKHSGLYVCVVHRINKKRVVLRVIALAVKSKNYDLVTRATRSYTLLCNSVILGFKKGLRGKTVVYKAIWRPTRNKELEVAMKMLNKESTDIYFKDFFNLAGKWAFLKSGSLVRFYGLALLPNSICSVLEYLPLGPLDRYLREKRDILKPEDLIEASSNLASALWHLTESNVVHGKIRCRKLLVNVHNENRFTVKLTDPGLHTSYDGNEIHWMPVECYADGMSSFESAKESAAADIWAFATTVWEIFSFGEKLIYHLGSQESYLKGERLVKPPACDESMYKIMLKCWNADPDARIQPQELMRDVNQILYAVYDSRRTHSYARPLPSAKISVSASTAASEAKTETTEIEDLWGNMDDYKFNSDAILELDESNVIPQGDIGHGFYGDVFRAAYYQEGSPEPIPVAVKKLRDPARTSLQDFEREINIMKQLNHPNIVKILGIIRDNESSNGQKISLVMEYIHLGSLRNHLQHYKDSVKYEQLLKYASDIAKGMEYLGSVNIVHRDLAARNILVVDKNHVKITDFGLARVLGASDYYILRTERNLPIKWYAPESLANGKFSVRSDVWSYGVTMCEMFNHGEEPQLEKSGDANSQEDFLRALEEGDRFPKPQLCPPAVYQRIIWPCWNIMSHSRPSFSELIVETDDLLKEF